MKATHAALLLCLASGAALATDPVSPSPHAEAARPAPPPPDEPEADKLMMPVGPSTPLDNLSTPSPTSHVTASVVLRVNDPSHALASLMEHAEQLGGYLSSRSDYSIVVRVPTAQTGVFMAVAGELGRVSERLYQVDDYAAEVSQLDAQLRARQEMLDRYFGVMASASSSGVLSVEREISSLVSQVEQMSGRRRLLMHQLAYSEITVSFRFVDRQGPETSATSSFGWINEMNLADLLDEFRYGRQP